MSEGQSEFQQPTEDPWTTVDLFACALATSEDSRSYWQCVRSLHRRGNRDVLEKAAFLAFSVDPRERKLGILTIAQLGVPERSFREEGERIILEVFALESDPDVLAEIGFALGHTGGQESITPLVELSRHADPDVRKAAVHGLGSREGERVTARLIELTQDPVDFIRDWATFSLATSEIDTPEVRDVLLRRTRDTDEDTRGEAMRGLAQRKDPRVLEPLLRELAGDPGWLPLEAAEELADPRLYPALLRLTTKDNHDPDDLAAAIEACRPR